MNNNHRVFAIHYFSSHIISRSALSLTCNRMRILDIISRAVRGRPDSVVCVVRTNAPEIFGGSQCRYLYQIQSNTLKELRRVCLVRVFDKKKGEFLNHAKFYVGFHFCFTENVYYHKIYYGSTNLTIAGLLHHRSVRNSGNYEEFSSSGTNRANLLQNISRSQKNYLREIRDILKHECDLQVPSFLRSYIDSYIHELNTILNRVEESISHTTKAQLFQSYIDAQILYLQTLSFISDLPGKKLTERILKELMGRFETPDPLQVEAMMTNDNKLAEEIASLLDLSDQELRGETHKYLDATRDALKSLKNYDVEKIREYYDESEIELYKLLEGGEYLENHLRKINEILSFTH